jgi:hypothetical protein
MLMLMLEAFITTSLQRGDCTFGEVAVPYPYGGPYPPWRYFHIPTLSLLSPFTFTSFHPSPLFPAQHQAMHLKNINPVPDFSYFIYPPLRCSQLELEDAANSALDVIRNLPSSIINSYLR